MDGITELYHMHCVSSKCKVVKQVELFFKTIEENEINSSQIDTISFPISIYLTNSNLNSILKTMLLFRNMVSISISSLFFTSEMHFTLINFAKNHPNLAEIDILSDTQKYVETKFYTNIRNEEIDHTTPFSTTLILYTNLLKYNTNIYKLALNLSNAPDRIKKKFMVALGRNISKKFKFPNTQSFHRLHKDNSLKKSYPSMCTNPDLIKKYLDKLEPEVQTIVKPLIDPAYTDLFLKYYNLYGVFTAQLVADFGPDVLKILHCYDACVDTKYIKITNIHQILLENISVNEPLFFNCSSSNTISVLLKNILDTFSEINISAHFNEIQDIYYYIKEQFYKHDIAYEHDIELEMDALNSKNFILKSLISEDTINMFPSNFKSNSSCNICNVSYEKIEKIYGNIEKITNLLISNQKFIIEKHKDLFSMIHTYQSMLYKINPLMNYKLLDICCQNDIMNHFMKNLYVENNILYRLYHRACLLQSDYNINHDKHSIQWILIDKDTTHSEVSSLISKNTRINKSIYRAKKLSTEERINPSVEVRKRYLQCCKPKKKDLLNGLMEVVYSLRLSDNMLNRRHKYGLQRNQIFSEFLKESDIHYASFIIWLHFHRCQCQYEVNCLEKELLHHIYLSMLNNNLLYNDTIDVNGNIPLGPDSNSTDISYKSLLSQFIKLLKILIMHERGYPYIEHSDLPHTGDVLDIITCFATPEDLNKYSKVAGTWWTYRYFTYNCR